MKTTKKCESPDLIRHSDKTQFASIDENDIKAFRAKNYVETVDELKDLNQTSNEVIGIYDKIKELQQKGYDMLVTVPDNGATCSIKVKYHITTFIERAKEHCDDCIEANLEDESPLELNVSESLSKILKENQIKIVTISCNFRLNKRIVYTMYYTLLNGL